MVSTSNSFNNILLVILSIFYIDIHDRDYDIFNQCYEKNEIISIDTIFSFFIQLMYFILFYIRYLWMKYTISNSTRIVNENILIFHFFRMIIILKWDSKDKKSRFTVISYLFQKRSWWNSSSIILTSVVFERLRKNKLEKISNFVLAFFSFNKRALQSIILAEIT